MSSKNNTFVKSLLTFAKLAIAGGLIWLMIDSGKLNFREHLVIFKRPEVFSLNILLWIAGPLLIATTRWVILLRGIGLDVVWKRCAHLTMVGYFFNSAMPGAVGGDIIKAVYVVREQRNGSKTAALLTVLLDRIVGLFGLFSIALMAILFNFDSVWQQTSLRPIVGLVMALFVSIIVVTLLILLPQEGGKNPVDKLLTIGFPGQALVYKVYLAIRSYRKQPSALLKAWALSFVMQCGYVSFYVFMTYQLLDGPIALEKLLVVLPVGILTTAIPLAPGGLGVGHVAFDRLFEMIAIQGGANVFNIVFIGQMSLNLLCVIPYLMLKVRRPKGFEELSNDPG